MIKVERINPRTKEDNGFDITIRLVKEIVPGLNNKYVADELRNNKITSDIAKEMVNKIADIIENY